MGIITGAQVLDRLIRVQDFGRPKGLTDSRVQEYADEASAIVMQRFNVDAPPAQGTDTRKVMDGLAIRLAVLTILADIAGLNPEAREAYRRERNDLLEEIGDLAEQDDASGAGAFFEAV